MDRTEGTNLLCPVCRVDLVMSERQNIEIDYCPKCRGVWLDRGELDKIIERSTAEAQPAPQPNATQAPSPWGGTSQAPGCQSGHPDDQGGYADRHGGRGSHGGHGSRGGHGRGFLGRLFD